MTWVQTCAFSVLGSNFTNTIYGAGCAKICCIYPAGFWYFVNETFTILGSEFGGTDGVDDLTFDAATVAAAAATFTITASADAGSVVYQWQVQTATGTRWSNVSGANSASLALTDLTTADNGKKYRVKLTSSAGAEEVISNTATLTVTAAWSEWTLVNWHMIIGYSLPYKITITRRP